MTTSAEAMEAAERACVVVETLSWVGTAFHHASRLKCRRDANGVILDRGGVDCAQSVYLIYRATLPDKVPEFDIAAYAFQWNLGKASAAEERYLATVLAHAREIRQGDARPGDLVLYRMGLAFAHGAIVMPPGWPHISHANFDAGFMLDRGELGRLARRPKRFFTLW